MKSLFKSRFRQMRNAWKRSSFRMIILLFLLVALILASLSFFFIKVFGFLYHQEEFPAFFKLFLSEKILMMTFLTMFMMMIMSALVSTLNIFFLSKDLPLLLSSPLRSRTVFAWKSVEVTVSSAMMVVFFSLPALFAYCYYFAPRLFDIAAIVAVFVLYILCGVSIGILIGLAVPAFFSVKKLQPVLSVVSIILISSIVIFLRMLRPEQFGNPDVINNLMQYMSGLNTDGFAWFPFYWIAKGLNLVAKGDYGGYLQVLATFVLVNALLAAFILFLQKRYYLSLYDKMNKGTGGSYRSHWKAPRLLKGWLGPYSTLLKKEVKTFLRSPDQWSQLLVIAAIVIVFVLNIKGIPLPHPSVKNIIAYLNLGMAAFIVAGLNSRFTFTTIPMENPGIVHFAASPFEKGRVYRFKLLFYTIPQMLIGLILFMAGDAALQQDAFARLSGFVFLVPAIPLLTVLAIYFSLKVDTDTPLSPQLLVASKNGISYMLWSLAYVVAGMIYFVRPMFLYYYSRWTGRPVPTTEIALWYGGFVLLNLALWIFFYNRSIHRWLEREY